MAISNEIVFFIVFLVIIIFILLLDLGIISKGSKKITFKESIIWTSVWISLAIGFYMFLRFYGDIIHGITSENINDIVSLYHPSLDISGLEGVEKIEAYRKNLSLEYITGYIIEYSLSIDNVFVILLIFISFGVDEKYYKKVLFWGILGAIIMRFVFIFLLSALITRFGWILFIFGGFLVFTAIKMFIDFMKFTDRRIDPEKHPVVRFTSRHFRVYPKYVSYQFWIRENGKLFMTPLFLVLLVIEFSDVIFAVDSVPAIFSVTHDPYIVFYSNVFAIIGLRSLFFLVSNIMTRFHFLRAGLAALLAFVGIKMLIPLINPDFHISTSLSLIIISSIIAVSILVSLLMSEKKRKGSH